jgi:biopolymer transport protein ExbD
MAMAVGGGQEGDPVSEINTTPLIDVMLVLLVMLLITLPPERHAVNLDTPIPPPPDAPPPPPSEIEPIRLQIEQSGVIMWMGEEVSRSELDRRLKVEGQRDEQAEIHIEPNRRAKYGVIAHVMASVQRNGLKKMGVIGGT